MLNTYIYGFIHFVPESIIISPGSPIYWRAGAVPELNVLSINTVFVVVVKPPLEFNPVT